MIGKLFSKLSGGEKSADKPSSNKSKSGRDHRGDKTGKDSSHKSKNPQSKGAKPHNSKPQNAKGPGNRGVSGEKADEGARPQKKRASNRRSDKASKPAAKPWDISEYKVAPAEGKTRFHDLGLPIEVMHSIADLGYEYASPIQAQSLPHTLNGHDVLGKGQTGTGKTAAFLLTIIDDLLRNPIKEERYAGEARALVIAPTRELVMQIADDAKHFTKYTDLKVHALVGGMDYGKQQQRLQNELVDILVATPGRLLDFCGNQDVYLDQVEVLVLDEADRMLDMGFIPQVRRIVRQTPKKTHRQTLFFSATFTDEVMNLADQWTEEPIKIEIEPESVATDTVDQRVYLAATDEKYSLLYNILHQESVESLIVFANRRDECRRLHEKLERHGFKAGLLSGEIAQNRRVKTLEGFKSGELKVLVATDVAGRGIHINGISHVVNFTLPEEPEDYVHRIGRTGRAGTTGTSISFACEDDAFRLEPIQELLGQKLKCEQPPEHLLIDTPPLGPRKEGSRSGDDRRGGQGRGGQGRGGRRDSGHRDGGRRDGGGRGRR